MTLPRPAYLSRTKTASSPPPRAGFYHATVRRVARSQVAQVRTDSILGPARTTLAATIGTSDTVVTVTAPLTAWPDAPFTILVDSEPMLVGVRADLTFSSITRDPSPATHLANALVTLVNTDTVRTTAIDAVLGSQREVRRRADVFVTIPRLTGDFEYGPIEYIGDVPAIGDSVYVAFKEGRQDELVALTGGGGSLNENADVAISIVGDQELLVYDLATGVWINQSAVPGVDTTAIHDNIASEIALITAKSSAVNADLLVIEDSAASHVKKSLQVGNLPYLPITGGTLTGALTISSGNDLIMSGASAARGMEAVEPTSLSTKAATVGPTSYPAGYSVMAISGDSSWVASTGLVETWNEGAGGSGWRIYQVFSFKSGNSKYVRYSSDGTTWDNWHLASPVFAAAEYADLTLSGTANTFQTVGTLTFGSLPTTRFGCHIEAHGFGNGRNVPADLQLMSARLRISVDGGATWDIGDEHPASVLSTQTFAPLAPSHWVLSATPTGTIKILLEAKAASTTLTSLFQRGNILATIHSGWDR